MLHSIARRAGVDARRDISCFAAGMACADYDYVELSINHVFSIMRHFPNTKSRETWSGGTQINQ